MELTAKMEANDEEKLKKIFGEMQMGLAMGKGAVAGLVRSNEKLEDIGKIMESIEIERDGTYVSGKATVPSVKNLPMGLMMMSFGMMSMDMAPPPGVEAVPLEALPDDEVLDSAETVQEKKD